MYSIYSIYLVLSLASSRCIKWAVRLRISPWNASQTAMKERNMLSGKRGTEGGKAAGTSSSNFQPNQLDNDKTSRTSSVVHRSRLSRLSSFLHPTLTSIGPLIHLVQDRSSSSSPRDRENHREGKIKKKKTQQRHPWFFGYSLRFVAARYPQPPERPKIVPGYPENTLVSVLVSSLSSSSSSHVWSHRA